MQGSRALHWRQNQDTLRSGAAWPALTSTDGHLTYLMCGANANPAVSGRDPACVALFDGALGEGMSTGCWLRGEDGDTVGHHEHVLIGNYSLNTPGNDKGWKAPVWSSGGNTGEHTGLYSNPYPVIPGDTDINYAVTGSSWVHLNNEWGFEVDVVDPSAAGGYSGRSFIAGWLANNQLGWTLPRNGWPTDQEWTIPGRWPADRFAGAADECFIARFALQDAEVCRLCACGIDGSLCKCDPANPTQYLDRGRLDVNGGIMCRRRICLGGTDPHRHHQSGVNEVCSDKQPGCPGGGICSTATIECPLKTPCNQAKPVKYTGSTVTTTSTTTTTTTPSSIPT